MKKFLLLAAMAAVALGASAGYNLEKVWEVNTSAILTTAEVRQGFGMDGKFFINDKSTQTVYVLDQNGMTSTTYAGGANCGITRDEAGNILISTAAFPGAWGETASIKVINPTTGAVKEYIVPQECGLIGRCDFLGFAKGDFFEDGVLYLTGGNYSETADPTTYTSGVVVFTVSDGEVNTDYCYLANVDGGTTSQSSLVINYFKDLNGDDALMYAYRSGAPSKLLPDGEDFTKTPIVLPGKGFSNGIFPFVWDGKELFIYPYKGNDATNYLNGWAIAEAGAENPLVAYPSTVAAAANGYQNNWLNAEVDADGVTIYQYYPGGYIAVYRLTKTPDYYVGCNLLDDWHYNDYMMELDEETGLYTLAVDSVQINAGTMIEYKVTTGTDWWPTDYNAEYYIGQTGIYNLVFTFNLEGYIVGIQVTKLEDPVPEMVYTVAGPAHVFGTEWDPTDVNNDMALVDGVYTWSKENVQLDDFFGFKVVGNHSWDAYEWPIGYENNYNVYLPDGAGIYDIVITFNPEAEADYKITVTLTKKVTVLRGDVDGNSVVGMDDLTALINYLVFGTEINMANSAICDALDDTTVGMDDLTALINYLVYNHWD